MYFFELEIYHIVLIYVIIIVSIVIINIYFDRMSLLSFHFPSMGTHILFIVTFCPNFGICQSRCGMADIIWFPVLG